MGEYILRKLLCFFTYCSIATQSFAGFDAEVGLESRFFFEEGLADQSSYHPSIRVEGAYEHFFESSDFSTSLFYRYDAEDSQRTHFDVREALWTYVGDEWEVKAGIGKVFWGVTESRHLVDIINQSDFVESLDGEEKLGQAMFKYSTEKEWGTIDLFWLPYFRERTFAGDDGRLLVTPIAIDVDEAVYSSNAENWRGDFAIRYSHFVGDLEFAVSHFSGTSRDPVISQKVQLTPAPQVTLFPVYDTIDQTGLELQYIYEEWLLKFEGISNSGYSGRYSAAVFGFEYTQTGIFETSADLGWIVEYLFDDRRNQKEAAKIAPHNFERDVFVGWRYALNDADSSEILGGFVYDPRSEEVMYSLEASKRLAEDLKLNIEAVVFQGAESDQTLKTNLLRDEDYIQLELVKYF